MIAHIRGSILEEGTDFVVITSGGVGYHIHTVTPPPAADQSGAVGLWTHLVVRENALDLYGFNDKATREIFHHLLAIPKVGPKSAQQILQKASVELLLSCIREDDPKRLAKLSGLGPKTAEKVVKALAESLPPTEPGTQPAADASGSRATADVAEALIALGYAERDAYAAASHLAETEPEVLQNTQHAITRALRNISRS